MFNLICLIPVSSGYHAIKNMFYVYHIIMSIKLVGFFCEINFYEDFDVVHLWHLITTSFLKTKKIEDILGSVNMTTNIICITCVTEMKIAK